METPNYYAIIPASVRYNDKLTYLEKFLYAEITALSNLNGYCCAGNEYFAKLYNKDKATISRAFSNMEKENVIATEYDRVGASVKKRRIYPLDIKKANDKIINGTETTNDKNVTREQEKLLLTIDKIVKDNNSSYENIIKLIIVSFNKDKKQQLELNLIKEYFSNQELIDAVMRWLQFKREKGQTYKETGLKGLLKKLAEDRRVLGEKYVLDEIDYSISANYSGIFAQKEKSTKFKKTIGTNYSQEEIKKYERRE